MQPHHFVRDEHEQLALDQRADLPAMYILTPPATTSPTIATDTSAAAPSLSAAAASVAPVAAATASAGFALLSAADAAHIDATLRRMAKLSEIWGKHMHSTAAQHSHHQTAPLLEETAESAAATAASVAPPSRSSFVSALDREWDECAVLWRVQHGRLHRLHLFWRTTSQLLAAREREAMMADIAQRATAPLQTHQAAKCESCSDQL